jgi:hypothetical protein
VSLQTAWASSDSYSTGSTGNSAASVGSHDVRSESPPYETARALTDYTFNIEAVQARVTFRVEPDGTVRRMTLHQAGDHAATRVAEEPAPDPAQFAGRYFSAEIETFLTIAVEDGRLTVRHRRYGPLTLNHAGGDRFTGPLPVTEAAFERDAAGRLTGFRVSAGGRSRDVLFERVSPAGPGG